MEELYAEPAGRYPDGHIKIFSITTECTGRHVFIFQTPWPKPNERIMEVLFMIDAARRAGAAQITAVLTHFAYGRGDRKNEPRVPIEASLVAKLLEFAEAKRIITLDLHAEQTEGSVLIPWDNLYASHFMIPRLLQEIDPENGRIMSTDAGGLKRAGAYSKRSKAQGIAFDVKEREVNEQASDPNSRLFIGDVCDRDVAIVDDESVSLSSLHTAAWEAARNGARKIVAAISHLKDANSEDNTDFPMMWNRLNNMPTQFTKLITSDTVDHLPQIRNHPLVEILDTSPFWAEVIWRTAFGIQLSPDLID